MFNSIIKVSFFFTLFSFSIKIYICSLTFLWIEGSKTRTEKTVVIPLTNNFKINKKNEAKIQPDGRD